jgi:FkbM family methyltransferase
MLNPNLPNIEINFFNGIKEYFDVVFDIGCREDIDYIENSLDKSREFHLFDPDPNFIRKCYDKLELLDPIDGIENSIYLNAIGLGSEEGEMSYYPNTQSFVFRKHHCQSQDIGISFSVRKLDNYCKENSVEKIDFLKIDTEGMEMDIFLGGPNIIKNSTKVIQFEFASTMIDRDIDADDLVGYLKGEFNLYLQKVAVEHPYYQYNDQMLTFLTDEIYSIIKKDMIDGSGCNLVAIKKEYSNQIYNIFLK